MKESRRTMITAWGKLYHRDLKPLLIYPEGRTHEDEFVTYRVFYSAGRVAVSERALYRYLQRGGSIMNDGFQEKRLDKIRALREAVSFFREKKGPGAGTVCEKKISDKPADCLVPDGEVPAR